MVRPNFEIDGVVHRTSWLDNHSKMFGRAVCGINVSTERRGFDPTFHVGAVTERAASCLLCIGDVRWL